MQQPATPTPNPALSLEEVLDDLCARFIINLPNEELESFERLCFQIEAAHWFYLDFTREKYTKLPVFNLKEFTKQSIQTQINAFTQLPYIYIHNTTKYPLTPIHYIYTSQHHKILIYPQHHKILIKYAQHHKILITYAQHHQNTINLTIQVFQHCPILQPYRGSVDQILTNFTHYKVRVPACGAIILNPSFDKCLLVKGWTNRSSWGFPKGKINKDEVESDCAIREVFEETSFNIGPYLKEEDHIELILRETEQRVKLFIIAGVPEDTVFVPRTRKEISKISWFPISEFSTEKTTAAGKEPKGLLPIPTTPTTGASPNVGAGAGAGTASKSRNYFMVTPFISKLKVWLKKKKHLRKLPPTSDRNAILTVYDNSTATPNTNPIPTSPVPSHPSSSILSAPTPNPTPTHAATPIQPLVLPPAPQVPPGFVPLTEPISLMHFFTPPGPPRHASFTSAPETPTHPPQPTSPSHKPLPQMPMPSPYPSHYPHQPPHMSPPPRHLYPSTPPQMHHPQTLHTHPYPPRHGSPHTPHTPHTPQTPNVYHTPATTPPPRSHPSTPYTPYPISPPSSPTRAAIQSTPPVNWQTPQKDKNNTQFEIKRRPSKSNVNRSANGRGGTSGGGNGGGGTSSGNGGNAFVNFKFDVEEIMKSFAHL